MKEIPLSDGKHIALVDDEDFLRVSQYKWHAHWANNKKYVYAAANVRKDEARDLGVKIDPKCKSKKPWTRIALHRLIMGSGPMIDHADGNALNCQRGNLRFCTSSQNSANMRKLRGKSEYKGIFWSKPHKKWKAQIYCGRQIHLGFYVDEVEAAKAYDAAAKVLFREFARINFPEAS